jgi:hypothetical protein
MAFKMSGPTFMASALKKRSCTKAIDPMYNGKPGVQQSDFKQFSKSPAEYSLPAKKKCNCWDGYERVPGTKPCAPGSCKKA